MLDHQTVLRRKVSRRGNVIYKDLREQWSPVATFLAYNEFQVYFCCNCN